MRNAASAPMSSEDGVWRWTSEGPGFDEAADGLRNFGCDREVEGWCFGLYCGDRGGEERAEDSLELREMLETTSSRVLNGCEGELAIATVEGALRRGRHRRGLWNVSDDGDVAAEEVGFASGVETTWYDVGREETLDSDASGDGSMRRRLPRGRGVDIFHSDAELDERLPSEE